jgi:hypothetical protein
MAEQQNTAVFKMVLCGDGGTVSFEVTTSQSSWLTYRVSIQLTPPHLPRSAV